MNLPGRILIAASAAIGCASARALAEAALPTAAPARNISFDYALEGLDDKRPLLPGDWRGEITLWLIFAGMDGTIRARGESADVNVTFGDLVGGTDSLFGVTGRVEVGKGQWGGFVETMFQTLSADNQSGPFGVTDVSVDVDQLMVDFGVMYRIGEWEARGGSVTSPRDHAVTLDLYGGGRYNHLELEVDPAALPSREQNEDWIDPIIGAKFVLPFADRWRLALSADIGGFGIESDFTWSATGVVGFDFSLFGAPATVYGGYRAIGWDFTDGGGANQFTYDIISHGPIIGLAVSF